ncbi:bifunctional folylpolyglutamate synthase/dihydrofolate synthase [Treponema rectale]|uniref:Dihydrofolate synthase/folylpolyglutamate synthase n=1 Tax=Treponema rectale TaxID=744512 RepID=A0A840SFV4_9SPIR|nr:folylpolyglutamate synthase/dihydrofolate synthase family protein [Treponema rectale]MBB5218322.1 dihydrofolate synthase/folylpolyglutamate synthase [Treponema rectale]QOS39978.1 bifunctional folylpolyglutamate synthase/dihydrofolate synthase [Treponema rectale]
MKKTLETFFNWLDSYLNFEKTPVKNIFWLDTMKYICEKLGNPQDDFKTVHIAGSKGKGSVAVMTAAILKHSGFKTGLYTSPHITDFRERICTPSGFFSDEIYEQSAIQIMECLNSIPQETLPGQRKPTWFEIVTAYAFLCFKNAGCTHAVIETGLGGRLDSTNIIKSSVTVLTRIELEHTEFLGNTVEKIAYEKAGIIKNKTPAVILDQNKKVLDVFRLKAEAEEAPVYISSKQGNVTASDFVQDGYSFYMPVTIKCSLYDRPITASLRLLGKYQGENALLASIAAKLLEKEITAENTAEGLSAAFLPGRFEIIKNPFADVPVILDGAHTVNSINFSTETLRSIFTKHPRHLLFGCAADKDVEDMTDFFQEEFSEVTVTKPGNVKSCNISRICTAFEKKEIDFILTEDFSKAIPAAIKNAARQNAVLLVTGSFYLVCEVKKTLGTLLEIPQVIS